MDSAARARAPRAAGDPVAWDRGAAGDDAVEALLVTHRIAVVTVAAAPSALPRLCDFSGAGGTHFRSQGELDSPRHGRLTHLCSTFGSEVHEQQISLESHTDICAFARALGLRHRADDPTGSCRYRT